MESESLWQRAKVEGIPRVIIKACEEGERQDSDLVQVILPPALRVSNEEGSSPLLVRLPPCVSYCSDTRASCFLALGSGLGLVGTASPRR